MFLIATMYFLKSLIGLAIILLPFTAIYGHGYEAPRTRMPNNIVKPFINAHIEYPKSAFEKGEEGVVLIAFTIDKDGRISDVHVEKSVSQAIDSAAVHLFNLILWEPAKYYGKAVTGESNFKIRYSIKRYKSLVKKRGYNKIPLLFEPLNQSLKIYTVKELDIAPKAVVDSIYHSTQDFIVQNLELPDAALKLNLTGYVKLRFIIEANGLPSNIMIVEPLGGGCTEEAIRVVQMIKWIPGIKNDEAVRTCYNLSFKFDPADVIKSKDIPNQSNTGI